MHSNKKTYSLDQLVQPLSDCLTRESAERLATLKADPKLQARVDELSVKCSAGTLSDLEREDYRNLVSFGIFIDILKSKARLELAQSRFKS